MSGHDELALSPEEFTGVARLFPLPDLVMFPHVVQPLHIFEPRYCAMLQDAMAGDRLIGMAHLEPGWQADYEGQPPVAATICLGRVISQAKVEGDRYNILLAGLVRARILTELPCEEPFRRARVELLEDVYPEGGEARRLDLRNQLLDVFRRSLHESVVAHQQFEQLLSTQAPLGLLTDVVAFTLNLALRTKRRLLEELNVDARADLLLEQLRDVESGEASAEGDASFPPPFSEN